MKRCLTILMLTGVLIASQQSYSQETGISSSETFQQNRSIGFRASGRSIQSMFSLNAMALLVPVSDNLEIQAMLGYRDGNFGNFWDLGILDDAEQLPLAWPFSTILLRLGSVYSTDEVSGFSTRLGGTCEMTFNVPGEQGVAASVRRASLGSGGLRIGIVAGVNWSFHRRIRLSAYYWPYYYRIVKAEGLEARDENGGPTKNYRCTTGISIPVILEIAVKPF